jgi:hypothetical protein
MRQITFLLVLCTLICSCRTNKASIPQAEPPTSKDSPQLWITHTGRYIYSLSTDSASHTLAIDTLGLYILAEPVKATGAQGQMQWQHVASHNGKYTTVDSLYQHCLTGVFYDDTSFYIHPPREGKFRILQFSPHPFICFRKSPGDTWQWDLPICSDWSVEGSYQVSGVDTSYCNYTNLADTPLHYNGRWLICNRLKATCESKGRISEATYIYNRGIGILHISISMSASLRYRFSLIEHCAGLECISDNKELTHLHTARPASHYFLH